MQAYGDAFARIYNRKWGDWARRNAPKLREFFDATPLSTRGPRSLLDLCCGTGQLSLHFLEFNYRVTGIDLSPGMLEHARANCAAYIVAGAARFLQGDAAQFTLDEPVQFAVSTFDALNHLPDLAALRSCLECVHRCLLPGGVFIFDLNTPLGLNGWATLNVEENPDLTLITSGLYDERGGKAWTRICGYVRAEDGRYDRFEETVYNTAFALSEITALLNSTGWGHWHYARIDQLALALDKPEYEKRIFIVAEKGEG